MKITWSSQGQLKACWKNLRVEINEFSTAANLYEKSVELQFQESHNNEKLKEVGIANDAWLKAIQEIQYADVTKENSDLRDIASARQSDKKTSNLVRTFYFID